MSYILEALKKAERERALAQVPRLTAVHDLETPPRNRPGVLAGGIVICVAAVLWFAVSIATKVLWPPVSAPAHFGQGSAETGSESSIREPASIESSAAVPLGEIPLYPSDGPSGGAALQISPEAPRPYLPPSRQSESAVQKPLENEPGAPIMESELPTTGVIPGTAAVSGTVASAGSAQARSHSLKEAVAGMTVSLVMYAEVEEDRIVYINGRKYAKGDYVDELYLIENITFDGVLLSYEGERAILRPAN